MQAPINATVNTASTRKKNQTWQLLLKNLNMGWRLEMKGISIQNSKSSYMLYRQDTNGWS